ncbi:23S rRNA (guanosine(2251)-2'-O)-methyltransferase RlmB [Belliella kenyensis]|uniref:23S rRNA (Guanosine(2251)-2'-O)-methyltransferase RlmB n=2 Tax=Belliella TaxID=232244 RepID=A0ABS9V335_9BACT|nr:MULTISPECIES: 23S rRNA (guanosine(2251)-2'-O)-methyltransferase RlmB [Belliella]MCH7402434.1 23S rRNA (guanosine(2251)-2'-O)-methyltransferase RlmB [Belliella kenyensis]MCH7410823.1 23S rRNA (guanosine(2251)-2'-O)-methyltransferase RlmB [Belliella filtrata]MDN3603625.1 23S rRNA (guanosine(2251)-2'-O)-methyltransferase RlmB [Belliella kenyensis]
MEKRKDGFLINKGEQDKDFLFGTRAVMEAIHAEKDIDKILINKELNNDLIKELLKLAKEERIPVVRVPDAKLNRITRKNHQGVIAHISSIQYASLDNVIDECFSKGIAPMVLVLDRITDVRNFGAIARTADCAGVHAIVIPEKGSAQINSDAVKTSAGALNFIPVCRVKNLYYTVKDLKKMGLNVVSVTEKTERAMYDADFKAPTALIMGSEEDGISQELMGISDEFVKIPLSGNIESLNVSVAAGVVIYEAIRQRN